MYRHSYCKDRVPVFLASDEPVSRKVSNLVRTFSNHEARDISERLSAWLEKDRTAYYLNGLMRPLEKFLVRQLMVYGEQSVDEQVLSKGRKLNEWMERQTDISRYLYVHTDLCALFGCMHEVYFPCIHFKSAFPSQTTLFSFLTSRLCLFQNLKNALPLLKNLIITWNRYVVLLCPHSFQIVIIFFPYSGPGFLSQPSSLWSLSQARFSFKDVEVFLSSLNIFWTLANSCKLTTLHTPVCIKYVSIKS